MNVVISTQLTPPSPAYSSATASPLLTAHSPLVAGLTLGGEARTVIKVRSSTLLYNL